MKILFKAAVLLLSLSIVTVSCTKAENSPDTLTGMWIMNAAMMPAGDNPTDAQKFIHDVSLFVFSGNTVTFQKAESEEKIETLAKGSFSYSVEKKATRGGDFECIGTLTFSGVAFKGGTFTRRKISSVDTIYLEAEDNISLTLVRYK